MGLYFVVGVDTWGGESKGGGGERDNGGFCSVVLRWASGI